MTGLVSNIAKIIRAAAAAAAGTTTVTGSWIDTQGYGDVEFTVIMGAVTAGGTCTGKLQYSSNGSDSLGDIEGSSFDMSTSNTAYGLGLHRPKYRYVRIVLTRATQNSVVEGVAAHLTGAKEAPVPSMTNYKNLNAKGLGTA